MHPAYSYIRIHKAGQNNGALCGAMYAARDWPYCRPEYSCRYGHGHTSHIRDSGNIHKAWSLWNCRGRSRLHFCTQRGCRSRGHRIPPRSNPFLFFFLFIVHITSEKNKSRKNCIKTYSTNDHCMDSSSLPAIIFNCLRYCGLAQCANP